MSDGNQALSGTLNTSLEASKIEATALLYPEEMREAFIWFAGYVCQECARNTEVVEAKTKALGFTVTAGTYVKILRGKWNRDKDGNEVSPILRLNNFLQIVERLRRDSVLSAQAGKVPFVMTPTAELIFDYIDTRRAPDRVCKFGLIIGPTGSQKTATFKQYCVQNNHGACVWVEAPVRGRLSQFITDLAAKYGVSIWFSIARKELKIRESVNSTKCIIIDNVQRLYNEDGRGSQEVFNFLQKLQDDTGCTIILCATPDFRGKFISGKDRGYFEQFEGRCGGEKEFLELEAYTPREDVLAIAKAFDLRDAEKHVAYLEKLAGERGRVRILFNALQLARQRAEQQKAKLTIQHVRAVRDEEDKQA